MHGLMRGGRVKPVPYSTLIVSRVIVDKTFQRVTILKNRISYVTERVKSGQPDGTKPPVQKWIVGPSKWR